MNQNSAIIPIGIIVLLFTIILIYLDARTEKMGSMNLGVIAKPIRLVCLLLGLFFGGLALSNTDSNSWGILGLAAFLIICAMIPGKKKSQVIPQFPALISYEAIPVIPSLKQGSQSLKETIQTLFSIPLFRVLVMLSAVGLFLYGLFWLYIHPKFMDKYGWIVILIVFLGYILIRVLSIIRLLRLGINKLMK